MIGKEFITAGRAIFTIDNGAEHMTFRVSTPKPKAGEPARRGPAPLFISVLTGPDNTRSYTYMGVVDRATGAIRATKGSKIATTDRRWIVATYALQVAYRKRGLKEGHSLRHSGKCGRCARLLTDPLSLTRGIGPDCWEMMGFGASAPSLPGFSSAAPDDRP